MIERGKLNQEVRRILVLGLYSEEELQELFNAVQWSSEAVLAALVETPESLANRLDNRFIDELVWFNTIQGGSCPWARGERAYWLKYFLIHAPPWVVNKLSKKTFEDLVEYLILARKDGLPELICLLPQHVAGAIPDSALRSLVRWVTEDGLSYPERILYRAPEYTLRRLQAEDIRRLADMKHITKRLDDVFTRQVQWPEAACGVLCWAPEYVIRCLTDAQIRALVEAVVGTKYAAQVLRDMPEYTQARVPEELLAKLQEK